MTVTIHEIVQLASRGLEVLFNNSVFPQLIYRGAESEILDDGRSLDFFVPPTFTASEFNTSTGLNIQDVEESTVRLTMDQHWEVSWELKNLEKHVRSVDTMKLWAMSAMAPLSEKVDQYFANVIANGITADASIIGANNASLDYSKMLLGRKRIQKQLIPQDGRIYFGLSPDDETTVLQDSKLISRDFVTEVGQGVRNAYIGDVAGYHTVVSNNVPAPTPADTAGAVDNGAGYAAGTTTLTVDALTAAPPEGVILTFAGHATRYRVQAGTTTTSLKILPALTDAVADNEVITFLNVNQNIGWHENAVAGAIIPMAVPDPGTGVTGAIVRFNGIGIRVLKSFDHKLLKDIVSFDTFFGGKMIDPRLAWLHMSQKVA